MGVNVELRHQGAKPRKGRTPTTTVEMVVDADDIFSGLLNKCYQSGRTPTLDKIDPYANTIIRGSDVNAFIQELPILEKYARTAPEKRQIARIETMSRKCLAKIEDHHLHFVGD
ncbi:hypothetical protein E0H26_29005 [Micromonospora zingiberis]|uniref:Uncharacterized protein n=1 Tax=Micromonospora zingiberis TaxID=2053011 RepID=A0A4R0FTY0_9ACTN|nr:hypothetical protein [Micromonospora zingiberis]TCB87374.1 hypothetical protein E0H26_29005 [Micromonospora zingiberis]